MPHNEYLWNNVFTSCNQAYPPVCWDLEHQPSLSQCWTAVQILQFLQQTRLNIPLEKQRGRFSLLSSTNSISDQSPEVRPGVGNSILIPRERIMAESVCLCVSLNVTGTSSEPLQTQGSSSWGDKKPRDGFVSSCPLQDEKLNLAHGHFTLLSSSLMWTPC